MTAAMPAVQLYFSPGACSFVPHLMLERLELPFEPVLVKLHKGEQYSETFKALNPMSQVPVLTLDGHPVTQIVAIIDALDGLAPQAQVLPREGLARARALQQLAWMNGTVHPQFTRYFRASAFAESEAAQAEVKAAGQRAFFGSLGRLDGIAASEPAVGGAAGATFLGGADQPGPADAYALVLMRWGTMMGADGDTFPHLWALARRVADTPAGQRAMARERIDLSAPPAA
jgi:glutathione S-transferase